MSGSRASARGAVVGIAGMGAGGCLMSDGGGGRGEREVVEGPGVGVGEARDFVWA